MGQQQLLLLVLSTVIVGLATVAGIQAFSEGQATATQDALQQRAMKIGSDLYAVSKQPTQLGGVSLGGNVDDAAAAAGYDDATDIPADGAGTNAQCDISTGSSSWIVKCSSTSDNSNKSGNEYVEVTVSSSGPSVTKINSNSLS